ncbi:DUF7210 family protein [Caldimonas taiwanensis]|jgi:hypothetical protein|uniref:DUF7210 family protein n=1 Tax=Caldimonas taiwanensis TaxID=307483 RepID=UPI0007865645|nr:hypothetical protein [Caldimonas taiwanensis]
MKVELLADHTHAGRRYPSGQVLDLPDEQARWLIGLGAAKALQTQDGRADAPQRPAKPKNTTRKGE